MQNQNDFYHSSVVVVDPEIQGGVPVFKGTRVPVTTLFYHLAAGDALDVFLDDFSSVTREQAVTLLEEINQQFEKAA